MISTDSDFIGFSYEQFEASIRFLSNAGITAWVNNFTLRVLCIPQNLFRTKIQSDTQALILLMPHGVLSFSSSARFCCSLSRVAQAILF